MKANKFLFLVLLPLLMAAKCNTQVSISRPLNGSTYCSDIPVQYDYLMDADYGAAVVVGIYHPDSKRVDIIQNFIASPATYTRSASTTIPWRLVSYERGKDVNMFIDVVYPDSRIPLAGTTVTLDNYKMYIPLENLISRTTKSVRICS